MKEIPDKNFYSPLFSPWLGYGGFAHLYQLAQPYTLVSPDRCYVIYCLARQALNLKGDMWECGVYQGGTAILLTEIIAELRSECKLHLFDTFDGMPDTDPVRDIHVRGNFSDTSMESVQKRMTRQNIAVFHRGFIPDTFKGHEDAKISFAHIDVDIYKSVLDSLNFIYPKVVSTGFLILDDYGFPSCPGAREAVDEFFKDKKEVPLILPTGQAVIYKI
jgi:O-methyltransferase